MYVLRTYEERESPLILILSSLLRHIEHQYSRLLASLKFSLSIQKAHIYPMKKLFDMLSKRARSNIIRWLSKSLQGYVNECLMNEITHL